MFGKNPDIRDVMDLRTNLLDLCGRYCELSGLKRSTVSTYAAGDGKFFDRVDRGRSFQIGTYNRVVAWFSDRWPEDAEWPAGISRPDRSGGE